tara:strand:+ start:2120 stop:2476 length:357 start_codon:yes stop_codon:yes gene_type:complete
MSYDPTLPAIPSDTRYVNLNHCYNIAFTLPGGGAYVKPDIKVKCSEVVIFNTTGGTLSIKCGNSESVDPASLNQFDIPDGQKFVIMGMSETDQLSAAGPAGTLYARAHWYNGTPQNRQ